MKDNQQTKSADDLKGVPGSMKLNAEERAEAARLGLTPSAYINGLVRGTLPKEVKPSSSKEMMELVSENAALGVENRMLKEQLNSKGNEGGLNGLDYVQMEMGKFKLDQITEQNTDLKEKLKLSEGKLAEKTEELNGIDKVEKALGVVPDIGEKLINVLGDKFPDATERLIDRLASGAPAQTHAKLELSTQQEQDIYIGKSFREGFTGEDFDIATAIMGMLIEKPELINEVKEFIISKNKLN